MTLQIRKFRASSKGNCVGFAMVELPYGLLLHDVAIHNVSGTWKALPQRMPLMGFDGRQQRDNGGMAKFSPIITYVTNADEKAFTSLLIEALREFRPDLFS